MDLTTAAYYPMGGKRGSLSFVYGDLTGVGMNMGNNGLHPVATAGYAVTANAGLTRQQIHPASVPINLNMGIPMASSAGPHVNVQDDYDALMTNDIMDFDADQLAAKRKFSLGFSLASSANRRGSNCSWLNVGMGGVNVNGMNGVNLNGTELVQNKRGSLGITMSDLNELTKDDDTVATNSTAGLLNKRSSMDMLFNKRTSMDMNLGMVFNNKRASMDMLMNNLNKRSSMDMLYNSMSSGMGMGMGMGGTNKRSTMDMLLTAPLPIGTETDNFSNQNYQSRGSIGGPGHTFHFVGNPDTGRKHSLILPPNTVLNLNDEQMITAANDQSMRMNNSNDIQSSNPETSQSSLHGGAKRSETSSDPIHAPEQESVPVPDETFSGGATTATATGNTDSSQKPCPLNPLSPTYSEEFVIRYQSYLRSLIHLMDKSESSRKQVRKLKMTYKKSMDDQRTGTTSSGSSANPNSASTSKISFAAIKSLRRKKSKKKGSIDSGSSGSSNGSTTASSSGTGTNMGMSMDAPIPINTHTNMNMNNAYQNYAIHPQFAAAGSRRRSSMMVSSFKMQFFPDGNN